MAGDGTLDAMSARSAERADKRKARDLCLAATTLLMDEPGTSLASVSRKATFARHSSAGELSTK